MMNLNTLSPNSHARTVKKRVGRGIGSGLGKTCGRGHKGQKARAGGYHKVGFEGGQMPLQRRLPKFGFTSRKSLFATDLPVGVLNKFAGSEVTMESLLEHNLISGRIKTVKFYLSGEITKPVTIRGIPVTAGAKALIEKCGGKIL